MPSSASGLALAQRYRTHQVFVRDQAAAVIGTLYASQVRVADLDRSAAEFAAYAAAVTLAGQTRAVHLSDAFLAAYLTVELARVVLPRAVDPAPFLGMRGAPRAGALVSMFTASKEYVRRALDDGREDADALRFGGYRATRLAQSEVMNAGRRALAAGMEESDDVCGAQRVLGPTPCPECLALADGDELDEDEDVEAHPSCTCVAVPLVCGLDNTYAPPTGEELSA